MGMHSWAFCEMGIVIDSLDDLPALRDIRAAKFKEDDYPMLYDLIDAYNEEHPDNRLDLDIVDGLDIYYNHMVIGLPPQAMRGDETLNDFKARALKEIRKTGFQLSLEDLEWICDGGYEG